MGELAAFVSSIEKPRSEGDSRSNKARDELRENLMIVGHVLKGIVSGIQGRGLACLQPLLHEGTMLAQTILSPAIWTALARGGAQMRFVREQVHWFVLLRLQASRAACNEGRPPLVTSAFQSITDIPSEYEMYHRALLEQLAEIKADSKAQRFSASSIASAASSSSKASKDAGMQTPPFASFESEQFQREVERQYVAVPNPDADAERLLQAIAPGYMQRKRLRAASLLLGRVLVPGDPIVTNGGAVESLMRQLLSVADMPRLDEPGSEPQFVHPLVDSNFAAGLEVPLAGSRSGAAAGGDYHSSVETGGTSRNMAGYRSGEMIHPADISLFRKPGSDADPGLPVVGTQVSSLMQIGGVDVAQRSSWLATAAAVAVACPVNPALARLVGMSRE